jgi:hypothetical protein
MILAHSVSSSKSSRRPVEEENAFPELSLGFKSMGTGTIIKISEEADCKAKAFFEEFEHSVRKETKSKRSERRESEKQTNFIKTEKAKLTNPLLSKHYAKAEKKASNESHKLIQTLMGKLGDKYQLIRLKDMVEVSHSDALKFAYFWSSFHFKETEHI